MLYVLLFFLLFMIDRLSKFWIVDNLSADIILTPFLKFSLVWNRGISWGMLHFDDKATYLMVTGLIIFVTCLFLLYTFFEYVRKESILMEVTVLAGAISNIYDRFAYGAVVDFIELHLGSWYWPTFNVADILIVFGVVGIFLKHWYRERDVYKN